MRLFLPIIIVSTTLSASPVLAQNVDFGDNNGDFTNDGACDDPRFVGQNLASTGTFLTEDILHDAADCKKDFEDGKITLSEAWITPEIKFGDDSGDYTYDGECDDPRFIGRDMADVGSLLTEDISHDASDCKAAYENGTVQLSPGWLDLSK